MSYSCERHGWRHAQDPCPSCGMMSTSSNTVTISSPLDSEPEKCKVCGIESEVITVGHMTVRSCGLMKDFAWRFEMPPGCPQPKPTTPVGSQVAGEMSEVELEEIAIDLVTLVEDAKIYATKRCQPILRSMVSRGEAQAWCFEVIGYMAGRLGLTIQEQTNEGDT